MMEIGSSALALGSVSVVEVYCLTNVPETKVEQHCHYF